MSLYLTLFTGENDTVNWYIKVASIAIWHGWEHLSQCLIHFSVSVAITGIRCRKKCHGVVAFHIRNQNFYDNVFVRNTVNWNVNAQFCDDVNRLVSYSLQTSRLISICQHKDVSLSSVSIHIDSDCKKVKIIGGELAINLWKTPI